MIDKNRGPTFQGPIMKPGNSVAVRVSVRKDSVLVAADGKEILSWNGDMGRFSSYANWRVPDRQNLFIGSQASFIIHEMSVTPVVEGRSSSAPAKLAYLDPAFQQWVKATQGLPAEQQIEAVSKKLMELNPGFDGKISRPKIVNGEVTDLTFFTDSVMDISPVRGLPGLKVLNCGGSNTRKGQLSDVTPLQGMRLTYLACANTQVSDLSPLRGMPLITLICGGSNVSDLSPLETMPNLGILKLRLTKVTPATVAALQKALPNCTIELDGGPSTSPAGEGAKAKTPEPAAAGTK
jgi:hypothetical protein